MVVALMLTCFCFCAIILNMLQRHGNICSFSSFQKPADYSSLTQKLCGKVTLVWVLRESFNTILVICILNHPL